VHHEPPNRAPRVGVLPRPDRIHHDGL
jgi:hypothetical protein